MFLETCPNNKRDQPTLEKIIMDRVRRGTTIITDGWGAYVGLTKLGNLLILEICLLLTNQINSYIEGMDYKHMVVNHSKNFKDPITGVHSNRIEGRCSE